MTVNSILEHMVMVKVGVLGSLTTVDLTIVAAELIKCVLLCLETLHLFCFYAKTFQSEILNVISVIRVS